MEILGQSLLRIQSQIKGTEAEETSSYHDLSNWRFPQSLWLKGKDVKNLLLAISFLGLPDEQQNGFRKRAHKIAEKYKFQGQWAEVEEFLLLQTTAPGLILNWYFKKHSPEDWFGDTLRRIIKIMRMGKTFNPYLPNKNTVNYPQRKRGYNDKGSLSSPQKLRPESYVRPEQEKTEIPELSKTSFYPDWYQSEKLSAESLKMEKQLFPDENN